MLNETRVNLKHLLEDIRDSYSSPLEEVIITELVANALDSAATQLNFSVDPKQLFIRLADNGQGMRRQQLKEYHNIAATTKVKGKGIGFAGVGAKLSLLLAEKLVTESRGPRGSRAASEWRITNPFRAPWKFIPISETLASRGTAVTIYLTDQASNLLNDRFVERTIIKHFYSLLQPKLFNDLLKFFYRKPVEFYVNNRKVLLPESDLNRPQHWFKITTGKTKRPAGLGFLMPASESPTWLEKITGATGGKPILRPGLSISTYGKIIKTGWEWLGIIPKNHETLAGIVEIPAMAEFLTLNKNDFLSDSASLKKYYQFRKAVQEAVSPVLKSLGEERESQKAEPSAIIKPLTRQIEETLSYLVNDFPELSSLIGVKRRVESVDDQNRKQTDIANFSLSAIDSLEANQKKIQGESLPQKQAPKNPAADASEKARINRPGLKIILEEFEETKEPILGRMVEDTLSINTRHAAWQKAQREGLSEYHIILSVALILSDFLEHERNAQEFVNRFILSWGQQEKGNKKLF